jgi:hypothetical protein
MTERATNPVRRAGLAALALALGLVLGGCAVMRNVSSDVSSYGEWPAGRPPGTYAFDRLPSQQADAPAQARVEAAAAAALAAAGFRPVAEGSPPDVLVQVAARVARTEVSPWHDPMWWHGGFGVRRSGPWGGIRWNLAWHDEFPRVEHEVALLLRDRASGRPLYEARASSASTAARADTGLQAMFLAALKDFPATGPNPRVVGVPLPD